MAHFHERYDQENTQNLAEWIEWPYYLKTMEQVDPYLLWDGSMCKPVFFLPAPLQGFRDDCDTVPALKEPTV